MMAWRNLLPWLDRSGRLSWLRLVVFVGVVAPLFLLAQWTITGNLGAKPLTAAIHFSGDWAVRLLMLSLLVTPLRHIAQWPQLMAIRRMVGVSALFYTLLHITLYSALEAWNLGKIASEIVLRFYLSIGFIALLGLLMLGLTSTDTMVKRLGAQRWNRLHQIVYGLAVLALLHFFLQSKIDVSQAVLMSGFFFWLMGFRLLLWKEIRPGLLALTALAFAAAVATALVEAAWYGAMTGIPALRVLMANLDFSFTIRSAWWVLLAGLMMLIPAFFRRHAAPKRRERNREASDIVKERA